MGHSNLVGIAIAAAILLATTDYCFAQEPSLDLAVSRVTGFDLQLAPYSRGIQESPYLTTAQYRLLSEDDAVPPRPFLYPIRADYLLWEQALADSTLLTEEGGTLLYPLLEVDFAGRPLPVILYVPTLHGGSPNSQY
jgi:hypothetical protein